MTRKTKRSVLLSITLLFAFALTARASELEDLRTEIRLMKQEMARMEKKMAHLEAEKAQQQSKKSTANSTTITTTRVAPAPSTMSDTEPPPGPPGVDQTVTIVPSAVTVQGHASEVEQRSSFDDEQEAAPRPNDLTLDPKYRGFVPIPNTPVLIKLNAKPRVDFTDDPQNTGNDDRFVTAQSPVEGDFFKNGGNQFNVNARGSRLSLDVRAPEIPGSPRFYYQNDFFGSSGGELPFRVQQLWGQVFNVVVGLTFSVFEDPDAWPDTVDYEGPNAQVFARRPLVRYQMPLNEHWQLNFGLEKPGSEVDTSIDPDARSVDHAPDGGFNVRWEDSKIGHVQFGAIFRDIAVKGPKVGSQSVFGWGLNLSTSLDLSPNDTMQAQLTYGQGLFRYFNDDFVNNDAAFDSSGELTAIPAFGAVIGYTHKWSDTLRSTASYGYVHLDNEASQGPHAYHVTHYGSVNLIWKVRNRLSLGFEALYGHKEEQNGADGDALRFQVAVLYSLFD